MRRGSAWAISTVLLLLHGTQAFAQEVRVGIREQLAYVDVVHEGRKVRIQRIQDTQNRLVDNWARTSRPCPPACIQPLVPVPGVQPVAELELLDYLQNRVNAGQGLLLDTRAPELYRLETIPTAVSVPASILRPDHLGLEGVLTALGARREAGRWDFASAAELLLFCNGPWSDDSVRAMTSLVALGYPPHKLKYFRGGLHSWRALGLTTIVPARGP